ncbi:unnamed protein product [Chrysoparadoxa australica]
MKGGGETKVARKTLIEQQADVGIKDPGVHASRQVSELDKFATRLMQRKKNAIEQIVADEKEISYLNGKIAEYRRQMGVVVDSLKQRRQERDRLLGHVRECRGKQTELMKFAHGTSWRAKREDSQMSRSAATLTLRQERGFGTGPDTTFTRKEMKSRMAALGAGTLTTTRRPLGQSLR